MEDIQEEVGPETGEQGIHDLLVLRKLDEVITGERHKGNLVLFAEVGSDLVCPFVVEENAGEEDDRDQLQTEVEPPQPLKINYPPASYPGYLDWLHIASRSHRAQNLSVVPVGLPQDEIDPDDAVYGSLNIALCFPFPGIITEEAARNTPRWFFFIFSKVDGFTVAISLSITNMNMVTVWKVAPIPGTARRETPILAGST